jgi:SAM-dependent methyltransferase
MVEWQERIAREIRPSTRVEHQLRYAAAAPIVRAAETWCDLGCGSGVAAAEALGDAELGRVVLADADAGALEVAGRDLRAREVVRVAADLGTEEGVAAARAALGDPASAAVTCFGTLEHLETFVPLVAALVELGAAGATVVLAVPNDAFWALERPAAPTMWGEGAFEELRRLLPADAVVARQVPLEGSHLVLDGGDGPPLAIPPPAPREAAVPSHFLCAFGPAAALLEPRALAAPADLAAQRAWERQRESDLALLEAEAAELRARARELEGRSGERPPAPEPA